MARASHRHVALCDKKNAKNKGDTQNFVKAQSPRREGEERGKQARKTHHDWQEAKRLVADAAHAERLALMRTCKSKMGERGARFFTA